MKYLFIMYIVLQLRVRIRDGGNPRLFDLATVTVTVLCNLSPPVFVPQQYTTTVQECASFGQRILTLTAQDADSRVSYYYL